MPNTPNKPFEKAQRENPLTDEEIMNDLWISATFSPHEGEENYKKTEVLKAITLARVAAAEEIFKDLKIILDKDDNAEEYSFAFNLDNALEKLKAKYLPTDKTEARKMLDSLEKRIAALEGAFAYLIDRGIAKGDTLNIKFLQKPDAGTK